MRRPKSHQNHKVAPEEWRGIPDMTGSYEMDGVIKRCPNKDMAARLEDHLMSDQPYPKRTGYGKR